jgi:hypothetical protein
MRDQGSPITTHDYHRTMKEPDLQAEISSIFSTPTGGATRQPQAFSESCIGYRRIHNKAATGWRVGFGVHP